MGCAGGSIIKPGAWHLYPTPNFVAAFLREHPRVAVTDVSSNTDAMLDAVAEHRVQLALIEGPGLRKDLHIEPFMEDRIALILPASHEWAGRRSTCRTSARPHC